MAELDSSKGAGYSIEAVLAAVILFTFAFGAVDSPEARDWSSFQNEIAARDLTHMIKKSGDVDVFLRNSNTGGIRTQISEISGRDLQVSGTVENLPLNQMRIGFHRMPSEIHINETEPVQAGDRCDGDLTSLDASSEEPILRADPSNHLVGKHDAYLYFGDTDASQPGGYNGEQDYDTVWVDNGTECVFTPAEGPYREDDIFLWGNSTDPDSKHYEFKDINASEGTFTVHEADRAFEVKKMMNREVNGIETDTVVNTVNLSSPNLYNYDVLVFQENKTVSRFSTYGGRLRDLVSNTSMLFMMNMTQADVQNSFVQDIGFKWTPMDYSSTGEYRATFSNYGTSEGIESYFLGLGGDQRDLSLKPGGQVISNQGGTETSRDDVLFARNVQYDADELDGEPVTGWSGYSGPSNCPSDAEADFEIPGEDYSMSTISVKNVDVSDSCTGTRGLMLDTDGDSRLEGPFLQDEIFTVFGRRYSPSIGSSTNARLEFAGSRKVELVNHREALENLDGRRAARIAYEEEYEQEDLKMIASTIYWLRGDTVTFEASEQPSSLSTTVIGGVRERLFLPYRIDLRWAR